MKSKIRIWKPGIALVVGLYAVLAFPGCSEQSSINEPLPIEDLKAGPTVIRPIEDFLDVQGTFCITEDLVPDGLLGGEIVDGCWLWVPPLVNIVPYYDPSNFLTPWIDFFGQYDDWIEAESDGAISFGTEVTGSITERPLADGRAMVKVNLHVTNAIFFVYDMTNGFDTDLANLAFGHTPMQVLEEGRMPALGDAHFTLKFINTAPGAPLIDITKFAYVGLDEGQEVLSETTTARAEGELHEISGYPEGTWAKCTMIQVNLTIPPVDNEHWDQWPVETVRLQPIGGDD